MRAAIIVGALVALLLTVTDLSLRPSVPHKGAGEPALVVNRDRKGSPPKAFVFNREDRNYDGPMSVVLARRLNDAPNEVFVHGDRGYAELAEMRASQGFARAECRLLDPYRLGQ